MKRVRLLIKLFLLILLGRLRRLTGAGLSTGRVMMIVLPIFPFTSCLVQQASDSPLGLAAQRDDADEVRRLLEAGALPDTGDRTGMTPLIRAARAGSVESAKLLLAAGADPNLSDNPPTREPWPPLVNASHKHQPKAVEVLLAAGADPNGSSPTGMTPLMMASSESEPEIVRMLLDAGARPETISRHGDSALSNAVASGSTECVAILLDRNPDIALPGTFLSSVARALAHLRGRGEILELLDAAAERQRAVAGQKTAASG